MRAIAAVLITSVVGMSSVAGAQNVRSVVRTVAIDPSTCSEAVPPDLDDAVALELGGSEWAISRNPMSADVRLRVGVESCLASPPSLVLSLHAPDGRGFHELLDLSRYTGRERARAVAIWTAERLFALSSFLSRGTVVGSVPDPAGTDGASPTPSVTASQQVVVRAAAEGAAQLSSPQPSSAQALPPTIVLLPQQQQQAPQVIIIDGSQQPSQMQASQAQPVPQSSTVAPASDAPQAGSPLLIRANAFVGARSFSSTPLEVLGGLSLDIALPRPAPGEIGLTFEAGVHYGVFGNESGHVNTWTLFASTFLGWTWGGFSLDLGTRIHLQHGAASNNTSNDRYLSLNDDAIGVSGALVARARVRLGSLPLSLLADVSIGAALSGVGAVSSPGSYGGPVSSITYEKIYWGMSVGGFAGVSYDF